MIQCNIVDVSGLRSVILISGPDAAKFLHGQCTQDIKGLADGAGVHAFVLTAKGKVVGEFHGVRLGERFYLVIDREYAGTLLEHFKKFIIFQKVEISLLPEVASIVIIGEARGIAGLPAEKNQGVQWPDGTIVTRWDRYRERDYEVIAFPQGEALLAQLRAAGNTEWTPDELERYRIVQGVPLFGRDFTEDNLPQETGLLECLHFNKGCYTGQEVVARLHYRGHVNKMLCQVKISVPGLSVDQFKTMLFKAGEKIVGPMTNAILLKEDEGVGFVYLPYAFVKEAQTLYSGSLASAQVTYRPIEIG